MESLVYNLVLIDWAQFFKSFVYYVAMLDSVAALVIGYIFARHQFRFESLHRKRFEILESLYEKLVSIHNEIKLLVNIDAVGQDEKALEQLFRFDDILVDAYRFAEKKRIFLSRKERALIEKFFIQITNIKNQLTAKKRAELLSYNEKQKTEETRQIIDEIRRGLNKTVPQLLSEIEKDFVKKID